MVESVVESSLLILHQSPTDTLLDAEHSEQDPGWPLTRVLALLRVHSNAPVFVDQRTGLNEQPSPFCHGGSLAHPA